MLFHSSVVLGPLEQTELKLIDFSGHRERGIDDGTGAIATDRDRGMVNATARSLAYSVEDALRILVRNAAEEFDFSPHDASNLSSQESPLHALCPWLRLITHNYSHRGTGLIPVSASFGRHRPLRF